MEEETIHIKLNCLSGLVEGASLEVQLSDTLDQLKQKVHELHSFQSQALSLVFEERLLQDDSASLEALNIREDSVLTIVLKQVCQCGNYENINVDINNCTAQDCVCKHCRMHCCSDPLPTKWDPYSPVLRCASCERTIFHVNVWYCPT
mmetsp:Transcript_12309/g.23910  ORF Transcript_12309/g.23910 Transcript_12309/m.23910 type:complete len:148 (-) Transcript_12309:121-564(-)